MKITIVIPFFNPGEQLFYSIQSILKQTYGNFELILIDDGSTDESLVIANSIKDERVKVISDGFNLGLPVRLNQMIDIAEGEYIARMDADDLCSPYRIEKQVKFLNENESVDLVGTGICSISNDNLVMSYRNPTKTVNYSLNILDGVKGNTGIAHATIMARRDWYLRNRYNESAKLMEDYQLWIDAIIKDDLKVGYICEPLYFYRESSSIEIKKLMRAYRNQMDIVSENYKSYLSTSEYFKLMMYFNFKLVASRLLNLANSSNYLINIRNRNTEQNKKVICSLQEVIKKIIQ